MKNDKKIEIREESNTKDTLDQILENMQNDGHDIDNIGLAKDSIKTESFESKLNYDKITEETQNKAKDMVISIANFYITDDDLKNNEYVNHKIQMDIMTISNLLFQMITSEHAIKILLREIDEGNFHPRMFEVLGGLQKSKMEIVKHLKQVEIIMENNYKTLQIECENKNPYIAKNDDSAGRIGTKALLRQMQNKINTIEAKEENEEYEISEDFEEIN